MNNDLKFARKKFHSSFKLYEMKKTKIPGSWGVIDDICEDIFVLRMLKQRNVYEVIKTKIVLFVSSNGVVESNISAYSTETELKLFEEIDKGNTPINIFSNYLHCPIDILDVGINSKSSWKNIENHKVNFGTKNIIVEDAMTRDECLKCLSVGQKKAKKICEEEYDLICLGEMGLGNTTISTVILSVLLGIKPEKITGYGAGIDKHNKEKKREIIETLVDNYINTSTSDFDILKLLERFGGFEIVAEVGFILEATKNRTLILIDGYITSIAALLASSIDENVTDYLIFSSLSAEPGHKYILDYLNKKTLLDLKLRMGQGTAATLALGMLNPAFQFYFGG